LKSLVLGGNGFIGTHLVDVLLEDGHRVRIYDRSLNGFRANPKGAEYVRGELDDLGLVREALEDIEVVFHFVSTTIPKTSNDDPVYDVSSNLVGTLRFLESCVQAGVRKVVFASSGGRSTVSRQRCPSPRATPRSP
jgi:UDP-glucose 4-epimerase